MVGDKIEFIRELSNFNDIPAGAANETAHRAESGGATYHEPR